MTKRFFITLLVFLVLGIASMVFLGYIDVPGVCRDHIELHSAAVVASEIGKTEAWVVENYAVHLWQKPTPQGRGKPVGSMRAGSRAVILDVSPEDYKVRSPLDGSIGWVNRNQVSHTLRQDTVTRRLCN